MPSTEQLNKYYQTSNTKIRVLTFQSREVLDILLKKGEYNSDIDLSRESRDYSLDIKQLEGANPIWCFSPVGLKTLYLNKFVKEDFLNGSLFDRFRCEMSLPSGESLNDLVLLELEIPTENVKVGLTHNAYVGAVVIPSISLSSLIATYSLEYKDGDGTSYFYPKVKLTTIYSECPLFGCDFTCRKDSSPRRKENYKIVKLYRGCNTSELDCILTREFSDISWWSTEIRDGGHYYEGGCIEIKLITYPNEEMEYLQNDSNIPTDYTFGSAEMECPKDSIWYSLSGNYIKEHLVEIHEVEPQYYDWELEEMKEDEESTREMKVF